MISRKNVNLNAEIINLVIVSDLVIFLVNLAIFAKKPTAALTNLKVCHE